jgi:O-antigen/teichoic acid export membrane protein
MSLKGKALRGSAVLAVGEAAIWGCSLLRNMILARILTKADFGMAATFAMFVTMLEFSGKLGVGQFLVRDREGDEPEFLSAAHLVQFLAAMVSSLVMVAAAWPMAKLVGVGDQAAAIASLALLPLINGLSHLDTKRFERSLRFGPSTLVEMVPQIVIALLAWPIGVWLADYRAMLVLMILKAALSWAGSHAMAERPYRWQLHKAYAGRMLRFGWPLVANGFVMFFMMRGDQFVVASFFSLADFGAYAAAASLAMAPTFFLRKVVASVMLPVMAQAQKEPAVFGRRYGLLMAVICAFSTAYAVTLVIGAEVIMRLAFGAKYEGSGFLLAWLTAASALRIIRTAPAIAAIAKGDTVNQMISNLAGGVGFLLGFAVAVAGKPIWAVVAASVLGEFLACAVSFVRLMRRDRVPLARSLVPTALLAAALVLSGGACLLGVHEARAIPGLAMAVAGGCLAGGLVVVILAESRREVARAVSLYRSAGWRGALQMLKGEARVERPVAS